MCAQKCELFIINLSLNQCYLTQIACRTDVNNFIDYPFVLFFKLIFCSRSCYQLFVLIFIVKKKTTTMYQVYSWRVNEKRTNKWKFEMLIWLSEFWMECLPCKKQLNVQHANDAIQVKIALWFFADNYWNSLKKLHVICHYAPHAVYCKHCKQS